MKFEYYQDKEGNAYELKTDLEQQLAHDMSEQGEEIEILNNIINKAIEYINENWGHWCSNHYKYATETINILKGSDKE